jgi:hypothetical protein
VNGPWVQALVAHLAAKPIALLRLDEADWAALRASRRGVGEFTIALHHEAFASLRAPTLCMLIAATDDGPRMMVGVIGNPSAITTIQSRVKLKRIFPIVPFSPEDLVDLLENPTHVTAMRARLADRGQLTMLSSKLSGHLIETLSGIDENDVALRSISASLSAPRRVRGNAALQEQSLRTALRAFGLASEATADVVELLGEDETAISRISVEDEEDFADFDAIAGTRGGSFHAIEDGFLEHEARWVRGLDLVGSDATGRAIYSRGDERLEVVTANRRHLENALGVDLIYINTVRQNVVMVQHKMLEPSGGGWLYRPDDQLAKEIARMEAFARPGVASDAEYRLHSGLFYLKFVKRNAAIRQGGILMPLDHYQSFLNTPASRGPRGGLRIDYETLGGRYMREQPFVDLIRAGYIGTYANDTMSLRTIIEATLADGGAVVAAIQSAASRHRTLDAW